MKIKSVFCFFTLLVLVACKHPGKQYANNDSYNTGTLSFTADESFAPILDQELYVFKVSNKDADPKMLYRNENDALRLFLNDSVRVAILARNLTPDELKVLRDKVLPPEVNCFAHDAVTMIINSASSDTLSSVNQIKAILNGKAKTDKNIVFDNPNSSLIRYLKKFSGNFQFQQKNVFSLRSNVEVIKYVSEHQDAIGFISYTWLLDPDDYYKSYLSKIKIVAIKDENNADDPNTYYRPSQNSLAMRQYPLVRDLYIINSTGRPGLGTGFASFMLSQRGQRIILRAGLLPDSIPTREVTFSK